MFGEDDGVNRRPSNIDRNAKLNYQLQINSRKRNEEKLSSLSTRIQQGALSPRNKYDFFNYNENEDGENSSDDGKKLENNNNEERSRTPENHMEFTNKAYLNDENENNNRQTPHRQPSHTESMKVRNNYTNQRLNYNSSIIEKVNDDENDDIDDNEEYVRKKEKHKKKSKKSKRVEYEQEEEDVEHIEHEIAPTVISIAPAQENDHQNETQQQNIDYSIFELLEKDTSMEFILKPAPMGLTIKCLIYRQRGIYPEYKLCLQREDASLIHLISSKKGKLSKNATYTLNALKFTNNSETIVGKLKANFIGTQFTLYDNGAKPDTKKSQQNLDKKFLRHELASVLYELNIFGFKGPRQMTVLIPGMDENLNRKEIIPVDESETMVETYKKLEALANGGTTKKKSKENGDTTLNETQNQTITNSNLPNMPNMPQPNLIRLINKPPVWNKTLRSYALNFNGRVTQPSVKNFQVIHPIDEEYVILQFGKINRDTYTCDFSYPLCALQAFGICLSSLETKIACD